MEDHIVVGDSEAEEFDLIELVCPFCNEQDFDLIGLKIHLIKGYCDKFNELVIDTRPTLRDLL